MSDFAESNCVCHMIKSTNFTVFDTNPKSFAARAALNIYNFMPAPDAGAGMAFGIIFPEIVTEGEKYGMQKIIIDNCTSLCYNTSELNEAACFER